MKIPSRQRIAALARRLVLAAVIGGSAWPAHALSANVVGVLDGDTVDVLASPQQRIRCRLHGIDAPEKTQPFGQASKKSLSELVYRKAIDVETVGTDPYCRSICRLRIGTLDVNREQLARGMAWVYRRYTNDSSYLTAEAVARQQREGLWADPDPTPPWKFRREAR